MIKRLRDALIGLAMLLLCAACAGNGPVGNGLGTVTAKISVTSPEGTCTADLANGKDQTNLTVKGLHLCGGTLDELHADKSDGAAAAIQSNENVTFKALDTVGAAVKALAGAAAPVVP